MKKQTVQFDIGQLLPIGLTIVVLGIALAYGLQVMGDIQSDMVTGAAGCNSTDTSSCGAEYNATSDAISGVAQIPAKLPLIVTVIVAAVIIGIIVRYLWMRYR